jgi:Lysyl oxidase
MRLARGRHHRLVGLLAIGAVLACAGPAAADVRLDSFGQSARWSGSIANAAVPAPGACTPTSCQSFDVDVSLPSDSFAVPGGMLVSLKWPDDQLDLGYDLDLYVYAPDGSLAGQSNMLIYSTAEGVWVPNPKDGTYRVTVVPRDVIGYSPFEVFVDFARGWSVHGRDSNQTADSSGQHMTAFTPDFTFIGDRPARPKPMLPDLVPGKPTNFHIESAIGGTFYQSFDRGLRHQPSCYPQETTGVDADTPGAQSDMPTRCLRWDQGLENLGSGPFEIRAYPNNGNGTDAYQAIYNSDGTYTERKAGVAKFSSAHGHIHYEGFDDTGLYTIGPDGRPGRLVQAMVDKGRCAVDTENVRFGQPEDGPPHYYVPSTCDTNDNQDPDDPVYPNATYFRSGISPGWDDTYPWFIPDQYIDITHVADGRYLIVDRINASGNVVESDRGNDTSMACVEFHATTVDECPLVTESTRAAVRGERRRHHRHHHRRHGHHRHSARRGHRGHGRS